eukprot:Mrub_00502.p1 GENE.Mrub_00502~~Mrub_00502.p1  ORF type:complete len:1043 (+),score=229.11 Mrub_00502:446-3130(+)
MHQRQEENAKVTGFIQNAIKSKINLDANHFRINNKKSIQICKKILGERSKKRVFEDLYTSKYEKEFNLQKLHEKYKHDRSGYGFSDANRVRASTPPIQSDKNKISAILNDFDRYKLLSIIGEHELNKNNSHYLTKPEIKYKLIGSRMYKHYNYQSIIKLIGTELIAKDDRTRDEKIKDNITYDKSTLYKLVGNKEYNKLVKYNLYELIGNELLKNYNREQLVEMIGEKEYLNYSKDSQKLQSFKMTLKSTKIGNAAEVKTTELKNAIGEYEFNNYTVYKLKVIIGEQQFDNYTEDQLKELVGKKHYKNTTFDQLVYLIGEYEYKNYNDDKKLIMIGKNAEKMKKIAENTEEPNHWQVHKEFYIYKDEEFKIWVGHDNSEKYSLEMLKDILKNNEKEYKEKQEKTKQFKKDKPYENIPEDIKIYYTHPIKKSLSISYANFKFDDEILKSFLKEYGSESNKKAADNTIKKIKRSYSSCFSVYDQLYKDHNKNKEKAEKLYLQYYTQEKIDKKDPIEVFEQVKKTFKSAKVNQTKASELFAAKKSKDDQNKENTKSNEIESKHSELDKRKTLKPNESYCELLYEDKSSKLAKEKQRELMWEKYNISTCTFKPELNAKMPDFYKSDKVKSSILMAKKKKEDMMQEYSKQKECTFQPLKALSFLQSAYPEKSKYFKSYAEQEIANTKKDLPYFNEFQNLNLKLVFEFPKYYFDVKKGKKGELCEGYDYNMVENFSTEPKYLINKLKYLGVETSIIFDENRLQIVNINDNKVIKNSTEEFKKLVNCPLKYYNYINDSKVIIKINDEIINKNYEFTSIAPEIIESNELNANYEDLRKRAKYFITKKEYLYNKFLNKEIKQILKIIITEGIFKHKTDINLTQEYFENIYNYVFKNGTDIFAK